MPSIPARVLSLLLLLLLVACGDARKPANPAGKGKGGSAGAVKVTAADTKQAGELFVNRCGPCHGPTGKGDGPTAKTFPQPPRDLTEDAWQASVTDDYLRKLILKGGAAVGKSLQMPGNPDLADKPGVVEALVQHVRGLKGKK